MNKLNLYPRDTVSLINPDPLSPLERHKGKLFTVDFMKGDSQFQAMGQVSALIPLEACVLAHRAFQTFFTSPKPEHMTPDTKFEIMGGEQPNRIISLDEWKILSYSPIASKVMWRVVD